MTDQLPLWHRRDPDTSVVAAVDTASSASELRSALCGALETAHREGLTGDESSIFTEESFPGRFVEYAGRRRLSDLCDPKFGAWGVPTRHRRRNRRGNLERVVLHRTHYIADLDGEVDVADTD